MILVGARLLPTAKGRRCGRKLRSDSKYSSAKSGHSAWRRRRARNCGIAHVLALEALDEMGIYAVAIAATSMGAIIGGAYAAGFEGRAIRTHILQVLRNRSDVVVGTLSDGRRLELDRFRLR